MIAAAVVDVNYAIHDGIGVGKNDIRHIAAQFPQLFRLKKGRFGARDELYRIVQIKQNNAKFIDMVIIVTVIDQQPAVFRLDGNTVAAYAFAVPRIGVIRAGAVNGSHILFVSGEQVVGISDPDIRPAAVEVGVTAVYLSWKQCMILIIFTAHNRPQPFPTDEIVADSDHGQNAAPLMSRFAIAREFTAVSGVTHVEAAVHRQYTRVFNTP